MAIRPAWYQHHLDRPLKDLQNDSQHMLDTLHTDVPADPCWRARYGCALCHGGRIGDITVAFYWHATTWMNRFCQTGLASFVCIM